MARESGQYPIRFRAGDKARVSTAVGMAVMALLAVGLFGAAMFTDIIWIRILFGAFGTLFVVDCGWVVLDIFTHETMFLRDEVIVSNFRSNRRFARADLFAWNWGQKCADLQEIELYREGAKMPFRSELSCQ